MTPCILKQPVQTAPQNAEISESAAGQRVDRSQPMRPRCVPRRRLIARVRAEIASGAYDSTDKLSIALARCLEKLAAE